LVNFRLSNIHPNDPQLLQPLFLPKLTGVILKIVKLLPKRKMQTAVGASA
jgi:hypothetical protein